MAFDLRRLAGKHDMAWWTRLGAINLVAGVLTAVMVSLFSAGTVNADETLPPAIGNNGTRIYLSPAYHTGVAGARGECEYPAGTKRTERDMARNLARRVADLKSTRAVAGGTEIVVENSGLMYRGFTTRIGNGDYDTNVSSSNTWVAHAHVPLHSNASLPYGCANSSGNDDYAGAREMYQAGGSATLANRLKYQLESVTPGLADKSCIPADCSQYATLAELSANAAARAYSETEFHDWNVGISFLVYDRNVAALRLARGIDNHF